jgi:hypothetical protein
MPFINTTRGRLWALRCGFALAVLFVPIPAATTTPTERLFHIEANLFGYTPGGAGHFFRRDRIAARLYSVTGLIQHTLTNVFASGLQASVFVIDSSKQLFYQSGSFTYDAEVNDHPGVADALQGNSGTTYVQVDGSEHVVAYSSITPSRADRSDIDDPICTRAGYSSCHHPSHPTIINYKSKFGQSRIDIIIGLIKP